MFIIPEIIAIDILNTLFIIFAIIAFVISINIILHYKKEATSPYQYALEKQSYLSATIIKYIFYIKVPLFLFFIFVIDKLSFFIPGAMCGAGVINSSSYGIGLMFLKILNIYLFAYWIILDKQDMKFEEQPYFMQKFYLFVVLFVLLIIEIFLESDFFFSLDVKSVVDCCGALFSSSDGTYLSLALNQPLKLLLSLFYINYILLVVARIFKARYLFSLLNIFFIFSSLISLVAFFGTYIYELPTHHCPFCMLQVDYNYIGYFLYFVLFLGTFNGIIVAFIEFREEELLEKYDSSLLFNLLYICIVTFYPLSYFVKNGVWL